MKNKHGRGCRCSKCKSKKEEKKDFRFFSACMFLMLTFLVLI